MAWVLGTIILLAILAAALLQLAIYRNGAAVLNSVDRLTGGNGGLAELSLESYGTSPQQRLLIGQPEKPSVRLRPVLIFQYGGSWRNGDPDDYDFIARAFGEEGFVVVLAGYRLHPDVVFPAMLEDTAAAVAWTKDNISKFGGDPDHIILAGHSAGAYNVVMTALDSQWLESEGLSSTDVKGVIGLAGPYDFLPFDSESTINSFDSHPDPDSTQPVNFVSSASPPMLLIHGEKDALVYPRNTRKLAALLRGAGVPVTAHYHQNMDHYDPLKALASPWRRRNTAGQAAPPPPYHAAIRFALNPDQNDTSSLPVQPQSH